MSFLSSSSAFKDIGYFLTGVLIVSGFGTAFFLISHTVHATDVCNFSFSFRHQHFGESTH